jgi:uncharacterized protein (DUF1800 family)
MMRYLDTVNNRKGQPNENFAREVMELFTLGEGHYSEQDIREAARAFTGWSLDKDFQFVYRPNLHDNGDKTIFGQQGNLMATTCWTCCCASRKPPALSPSNCGNIWSPPPRQADIQRLSALFYRDNYEIRPLLRAMLLTPAFWSSQGQLVKSPLELTVGTLVTFDLTPPDWRALAGLNRQLGQDVFNPPNVKGWPGGDAWINSSTLLTRKQFLDRLSHDAAPIRNSFVMPMARWMNSVAVKRASAAWQAGCAPSSCNRTSGPPFTTSTRLPMPRACCWPCPRPSRCLPT